MIDLSPQPHDESSSAAELHSKPRPDPILAAPPETVRPRGSWAFTHDQGEAAIQLLSRWAGPLALLISVILLGWWLLG
jgi:hypothetical protein